MREATLDALVVWPIYFSNVRYRPHYLMLGTAPGYRQLRDHKYDLHKEPGPASDRARKLIIGTPLSWGGDGHSSARPKAVLVRGALTGSASQCYTFHHLRGCN